MHKLSRLHFHECGYVDSYKDSLTIGVGWLGKEVLRFAERAFEKI